MNESRTNIIKKPTDSEYLVNLQLKQNIIAARMLELRRSNSRWKSKSEQQILAIDNKQSIEFAKLLYLSSLLLILLITDEVDLDTFVQIHLSHILEGNNGALPHQESYEKAVEKFKFYLDPEDGFRYLKGALRLAL